MNITIAKNGQKIGPFDETQVADMLKSGMLASSDLGWTEGMNEWKPLSSFGQFQSSTTEPPPVPGYPASAPQETKMGVLPVISLVMGIISLFCIPLLLFHLPAPLILLAFPAIICGHIARRKLKKRCERKGMGMALGGVITGYIAVLGFVLVVAIPNLKGIMLSARVIEISTELAEADKYVRGEGFSENWDSVERAVTEYQKGIQIGDRHILVKALKQVSEEELSMAKESLVVRDGRLYLKKPSDP